MSDLRFHDLPVLPRGFGCASTHCGLKSEAPDLSLFASERPCSAAAVFTRNLVPGAPILVGRELIGAGRLQAVVVNSGVANVGTGEAGLEAARRMGRAAAAELDLDPALVLMSSTGVIGVELPIEKIEAGLRGLGARLQSDPLVGARGLMTTDTHPKALSLSLPGSGETPVTLSAVAKGSGMIAPDMATMLCYLFTDARVEAAALDGLLRHAVAGTFNRLSVDSDTSTSDTCAILANGLAGMADPAAFREGLQRICERITEMLARDGEGATRLLRVHVDGAATRDDARTVARALVDSPLVKTMVHGGDPNVGRLLMAVGKCVSCRVEPERLSAWIGPLAVVRGGRKASFAEADVRALLLSDPVDLRVDLGVGDSWSRAWGCDLSHGYIDENAAYASS